MTKILLIWAGKSKTNWLCNGEEGVLSILISKSFRQFLTASDLFSPGQPNILGGLTELLAIYLASVLGFSLNRLESS